METSLQITFRNVESTEIAEEWIRAEVAKLSTFYNRIMGCRVAVEMPHRHHKRGRSYHVRIDLTVPGEEIVIKREPSLSPRVRRLGDAEIKKRHEVQTRHRNLGLAINDAFKAAARRLQDYARRHRGEVKSHSPLQVGRVSRLLQEEGYGFLTSDDGRGIYFHRNSVLNRAFPRLNVGTMVSFLEETGEKGLQASTVRIIGKGRGRQKARQLAISAN